MIEAETLSARVSQAYADSEPLRIAGAGSKHFLQATDQSAPGAVLDMSDYAGVISYEPTELVLTARCGTPIAELESLLAQEGQALPFDPPLYSGADTLGGVVACAASGPSRSYRGGVRDFILGTRIINGRGEDLRFGGEVMKNVAGYDVSRLQVGARGSLGALLDLSVKVLPRHETQETVSFICDSAAVLGKLIALERQPLPLDAAAIAPHTSDNKVRLVIRFSGTAAAVKRAVSDIGGDVETDSEQWWLSLRDLTHPFFDKVADKDSADLQIPLWRFTVPADTPLDAFVSAVPGLQPNDWLFDWGGRLRWVKSDASLAAMSAVATSFKGQVSRLGSGSEDSVHAADMGSASALENLHMRIKASFDPRHILNRGVLAFEQKLSSMPVVEPLTTSITT